MDNSSPARNVGGRPRNAGVNHVFMRARREELGLSRGRLVTRMKELGCAVTRTAIYEWERGAYAPSESRLAAWCGALKVNREQATIAAA